MNLIYFILFIIYVLIRVQAACTNNCSDNGHCKNDKCSCNQNYIGSDCSIQTQLLQKEIPLIIDKIGAYIVYHIFTDTNPASQQLYFQYENPIPCTVSVQISKLQELTYQLQEQLEISSSKSASLVLKPELQKIGLMLLIEVESQINSVLTISFEAYEEPTSSDINILPIVLPIIFGVLLVLPLIFYLKIIRTSNRIVPEPVCSICNQPINNDFPLVITPCQHQIHKDCLKVWLRQRQNRCPNCEQVVQRNQFQDLCSICNLYKNLPLVITPCQHKFHQDCLKARLRRNRCPFCEKVVQRNQFQDLCSICNLYQDLPLVITHCKHKFHKDCLTARLRLRQNRCPFCKQVVQRNQFQDLCSICNLYQNLPLVITPCQHKFHKDCLTARLRLRQNRCPFCEQVGQRNKFQDLCYFCPNLLYDGQPLVITSCQHKFHKFCQSLESTNKCPYCLPIVQSNQLQDLCSICNQFRNQPLLITPCQHKFHTDCIISWLVQENKCPNCEQVVQRNQLKDLCSLCQDNLNTGLPLVITSCQHKFHKDCLYQSLESTNECPYCLAIVQSNQLQDLCSICNEFRNQPFLITLCQHKFHTDCLERTLHQNINCPQTNCQEIVQRDQCQDLCSLCQLVLRNGFPLVITPCQHKFHKGCILTRLLGEEKKCPDCPAQQIDQFQDYN